MGAWEDFRTIIDLKYAVIDCKRRKELSEVQIQEFNTRIQTNKNKPDDKNSRMEIQWLEKSIKNLEKSITSRDKEISDILVRKIKLQDDFIMKHGIDQFKRLESKMNVTVNPEN